MHRSRSGAAAILCLCLAASASSAQPAKPAPPQPPVERTHFALLGAPRLAADGFFTAEHLAEPGGTLGGWKVGAGDRVVLSGKSNRSLDDGFVIRNSEELAILERRGRKFRTRARARFGDTITTVDGRATWTFGTGDTLDGFGVFDGGSALVLHDGGSIAVMRPDGMGVFELLAVVARARIGGVAVAAQAASSGGVIVEVDVFGTTFWRWNNGLVTLATIPTGGAIDGTVVPGASGLQVGDVDADGRDDVVIASLGGAGDDLVAIGFADDAAATPRVIAALDFPHASAPGLEAGERLVAVGELWVPTRGLELVTRNDNTGRLSIFTLASGYALLAQADAGKAISGHLFAGGGERFFGAADLDGDSVEELLVGSRASIAAVELAAPGSAIGFPPFAPIALGIVGVTATPIGGTPSWTFRASDDVVPYVTGGRAFVLATHTAPAGAVDFAEAEAWNRANAPLVVCFDRGTGGVYAKRNGELDAARVAAWQRKRGLRPTGRVDERTCEATKAKPRPKARPPAE